ncbi:MAG: hypothetical protein A2289_09375 [Deltaproteobacteria bacterium RIFOXYA12_FULL_58_15]|nr:MAG: hypothetical protein A2289_09375 [Deltaproteobacteria bacterium RIFOXYA12_FULL_58_15]OGR12333.1 MAG: hypothetical protein A2341_06335 [Deltaproteobacteria bacterium RIFOXYB12_FULL_58_9]
MMRTISCAALLAVTSLSCGDDSSVLQDDASVLVDIDLSAFSIPAELDSMNALLFDAEIPVPGDLAFYEHNHPLSEDRTSLKVEFIQGPQTPDRMTLVVCGFRQSTVVGSAEQLPLVFEAGEQTQVEVRMGPHTSWILCEEYVPASL